MKTTLLRLGFILTCLLLFNCAPIIPSTPGLNPRLFPTQEDDTLTPTPTPTLPITPFNDAMNGKSDCFSGTSKAYQVVTSINEYEIVNILGKNDDKGDWVLIRSKDKDCWIEASFLPKYQEYKQALKVVSTPLPPTATVIAPTRTAQSNDTSSGSGTSQALTAQAAQAQTAQAAQAQTAQAAQAQTAQALTSESAHGRQCNDGVDNDDDGRTDYPADEGCNNRGDDSE